MSAKSAHAHCQCGAVLPFTQDDVENLREFDNFLLAPRKTTPYWMDILADKIAALLPKEHA